SNGNGSFRSITTTCGKGKAAGSVVQPTTTGQRRCDVGSELPPTVQHQGGHHHRRDLRHGGPGRRPGSSGAGVAPEHLKRGRRMKALTAPGLTYVLMTADLGLILNTTPTPQTVARDGAFLQ